MDVVAVAELRAGTPVHGAFCFIDGELPLLGTPTIHGLPLLHRRSLAKRLNADGPLSDEAIAEAAANLIRHFPPAQRARAVVVLHGFA